LNRYLAERLKYPTGRNGYGESNHQRATWSLRLSHRLQVIRCKETKEWNMQ
jgi:hypothetical protein